MLLQFVCIYKSFYVFLTLCKTKPSWSRFPNFLKLFLWNWSDSVCLKIPNLKLVGLFSVWQRKTVPKVSLLVNIGEIEWWWKFEHNLLIKLKHSMLCCAFDNVYLSAQSLNIYSQSTFIYSSSLLSQAWHQLIAPWFDGFIH